jgi:ubiquinone/menaquinone biosynthesis C-methylase UbiE
VNADFVHTVPNDFENVYLRLREKEQRIYSDQEVLHLPDIDKDHVHHREWEMRSQSARRLVNYLLNKKQPLKILEAGCGNGWLSHRLAEIPGAQVIGTDINFAEIQQAARVFADVSNLHFIYSPIDGDTFEEGQFDMIVFAASIQYFSSLASIINRVSKWLHPNGEIHILDTYFYTRNDLDAARQRSAFYFQGVGFSEMTNWYFHHCLDDLQPFNYSVLYDPNRHSDWFSRKRNPFPWIMIK